MPRNNNIFKDTTLQELIDGFLDPTIGLVFNDAFDSNLHELNSVPINETNSSSGNSLRDQCFRDQATITYPNNFSIPQQYSHSTIIKRITKSDGSIEQKETYIDSSGQTKTFITEFKTPTSCNHKKEGNQSNNISAYQIIQKLMHDGISYIFGK
ncbi:hypothetical protein GJ496_009087 [Pomphorhynchus laevis]|nr:hypothetical protein GJ496_009087 [Pomphorhynchus laevis]